MTTVNEILRLAHQEKRQFTKQEVIAIAKQHDFLAWGFAWRNSEMYPLFADHSPVDKKATPMGDIYQDYCSA